MTRAGLSLSSPCARRLGAEQRLAVVAGRRLRPFRRRRIGRATPPAVRPASAAGPAASAPGGAGPKSPAASKRRVARRCARAAPAWTLRFCKRSMNSGLSGGSGRPRSRAHVRHATSPALCDVHRQPPHRHVEEQQHARQEQQPLPHRLLALVDPARRPEHVAVRRRLRQRRVVVGVGLAAGDLAPASPAAACSSPARRTPANTAASRRRGRCPRPPRRPPPCRPCS